MHARSPSFRSTAPALRAVVRRAACAIVAALACASLASAAPRAAERAQFEAAYQAAARGPAGAWRTLARGLADYPLYPYLEFAALTRSLNTAAAADVQKFLDDHQGSVLERDLRARWLARLAREKRWPEFHRLYRQTGDLELRCHDAAARIAVGDTDTLYDDARALFVTGRSLPASCDAMVAWIRRQPGYDDALVWERIRNAAAGREAGLVTHLATQLQADRTTAARWGAVLGNPAAGLANVASWPDTARDRELAALATAGLARRDAALAAQRWAAVERRYRLTDAERAPALNAIALYKAASYDADAGTWLARVPVALTDDAVREWRVRVALAAGDYRATVAAVEVMTEKQRADPRYRYVEARALEALGRTAESAPLFAALAREANYHGFLAADRLGEPYSVCPADAQPPAEAERAVAADGSIARALELHAIGWASFARREWDYGTRDAGSEFRRAAVAKAHAAGWIDRGPLTLLKPEEQRWYALRFPLGYERAVERGAARHGLDEGWVFGLIRSESAWVSDARSGADARGLMQLLPAVGAAAARREKLTYKNGNDLYQPELNIALGTSHLASELRRYAGRVWLATAAYNAGPAPVQRWLGQRAALPNDLWVETIPYKETREYVARVLAFSVIYDWRRHGKALPIGPKLALKPARNARHEVVCAAAVAPPPATPPPATQSAGAPPPSRSTP